MQWWEKDNEFFENFKEDLKDFPSLKFRLNDNNIVIEGKWLVYGKELLIAEYDIQIFIPENFPNEVPKVFEVSNCIKRDPDHHINYDGTACLFAPPERWEKWPKGTNIKILLNGAIKQYFFSQAYFARTGEWPFGEWEHGDNGTLQYYLEKLEIKSLYQLREFQKISKYTAPYRQWKCPCGNKRYKACHWKKMKELINTLPNKEWNNLKNILDFRLK